jgi:hypothetical protein
MALAPLGEHIRIDLLSLEELGRTSELSQSTALTLSLVSLQRPLGFEKE